MPPLLVHYGPIRFNSGYYGAACEAPVGDLVYVMSDDDVTCGNCKEVLKLRLRKTEATRKP